MAERNHADNRPSALKALTLSSKRAALAHEGREAGEHFREVAAGLALHAHGGDQEQQIILADPAMQVDDGGRYVLAERRFPPRSWPSSPAIGSRISLAASPIALTNGWPIRRLRTIMSSASGSWAVKRSIRLRRTIDK